MKNEKQEKQINVRLDESTYLKLQKQAKDTGIKPSTMIRGLIQEGKVNYIPEGKNIIGKVMALRDEVNQTALQIEAQMYSVEDAITALKKELEDVLYKKGVPYSKLCNIEEEIKKREIEITKLKKIWQEEEKKASKGVNDYVNF
jgi:hypothetical protein